MSKKIYWSTENVEMPTLDFQLLEKWIVTVAAQFKKKCGEIAYCFSDDHKIIQVNRQFLQHDYYTDIITFDYSTKHTISGDILISLDTVRSNALLFNQPYERELLRVIIHGILHLCGINDKTPQERLTMENAENQALLTYAELSQTNPNQPRHEI